MGQKVIPTSLRLYKKKNWNSNWVVEKNKYSDLLHFDLEIRKYFENIYNYNNIKLLNLKIKKVSKNINIYIYIHKLGKKNYYKIPYYKIINKLNLYYTNHNIKIFIKNLKKSEFYTLKNHLKQIFYLIRNEHRINKDTNRMIYTISYALYSKRIQLITFLVKQMLQRKKSHKRQISNIERMLNSFFKIYTNFIGYRLQFKGRINGSKRKRKVLCKKGKTPLNTLDYNILYDFNEFKTPSGICSIKLWVFIKN